MNILEMIAEALMRGESTYDCWVGSEKVFTITITHDPTQDGNLDIKIER